MQVVTQRAVSAEPEALQPTSRAQPLGNGAAAGDIGKRRLPKKLLNLAAVGYLCTGTALAILGQLVVDQGATDPSTQLIAWTKYVCVFTLSLALQLLTAPARKDQHAPTDASSRGQARKAQLLTAAVGLLDTLSYGLNVLGFSRCGSALSMVVFAACGQVFTAIARRLLLRKTMTAGQALGVVLVVVGLIVRAVGKASGWPRWRAAVAAAWGTATGAGGTKAAFAAATDVTDADLSMALGVGLVAASALGYSLLGCLYEWLSAIRGPNMSHAQVATSTAAMGLVATTAYQAVYTAPRWRALVADPMAARGLRWWPVLRLYGMFGALFTAHGLVQGVLLQRSGATAVGIVSALRAVVVAVASAALFCRPSAPNQCLTPPAAASAAVVTAGALLWTLAGPPRRVSPTETTSPEAGGPTATNLSYNKFGKLS